MSSAATCTIESRRDAALELDLGATAIDRRPLAGRVPGPSTHQAEASADDDAPHCPRCWSDIKAGAAHCDWCGAVAPEDGWHRDPMIGRVLDDHYALEARIGDGGTAFVYRARDQRLQRDVAIKILRPEHAGTVRARRFLSEARLASRLTSPHTVRIFGFGETRSGIVYIVMEMLRGCPLDAVQGAQSAAFVTELLVQIGEALREAHGMGIVHRDLKPANIFVVAQRSRPHFKLLDFSIARAFTDEAAARLTRTGFIVGTPRWMSPEQVVGLADIDGRSDLFSLGLLARELLTGAPSTRPTSNEREVMLTRLTDDVTPLRSAAVAETLPTPLVEVIDAMLARDREARLPTADGLLEHLERGRQAAAPVARVGNRPTPDASGYDDEPTLIERLPSPTVVDEDSVDAEIVAVFGRPRLRAALLALALAAIGATSAWIHTTQTEACVVSHAAWHLSSTDVAGDHASR